MRNIADIKNQQKTVEHLQTKQQKQQKTQQINTKSSTNQQKKVTIAPDSEKSNKQCRKSTKTIIKYKNKDQQTATTSEKNKNDDK